MNRIDFSPLYRSTVGFDRLGSLLDAALQSNESGSGYPPYNIERLDDTRYRITLAVAGFDDAELGIQVEKEVLTVTGKKADETAKHDFLYHGIAHRSFERRFQLADHVEVVAADLANGILSIDLVKQIPEAMKPRRIEISRNRMIEQKAA